ncbi:hypothetical protein EQZ23_03045 [Sphingomonas sp. UV9]|uniref:hypothetical protein n=1 Tax=Sphingomonas sp. UV9 TaxID=1851410 RepID=UPI000FFB405C|nr:hypothetical protein [Sphingomonas sp. UV9]RXD07074.1 hypothetical protein EQZ23_03045 [Sphingomonas sp. UV9]
MNAIHTEMLYFQRRLDATRVMADAAAGPCARLAHETLARLYGETLAALAATLPCPIAEPVAATRRRVFRVERVVTPPTRCKATARPRLTLKLAS